MSSGREYRERLIEEVRRRPALWDTAHSAHRDMDARDQCWQDISRALGTNSEVLKREWKTLRDSLRQSLRSRAPHGKRWRYQARMAFLFPYMTKRTRRQIPRLRIKTDEDAESGAGGGGGAEEEGYWGAAAGAPAPNGGGAAGADRAVGGAEAEGEGSADALELFFAAVCCAARRLPAGGRRALQRAVLAALHAAEEAADTHLPSHSHSHSHSAPHSTATDY